MEPTRQVSTRRLLQDQRVVIPRLAEAYLDAAAALRRADVRDAPHYRQLFEKGMALARVSVKDISRAVDVYPCVALKWVSGEHTPHLMTRRQILDYLAAVLERRAKKAP